MSNSLRPHGLQHARPPCPSPKPKFNSMHSFWIHRRCPGNSWKWPNSSFLIQSLAIDRRRCWVWGVSYGSSVQFSSVALSCLTLCNPMGCSMPGFPIHHQPPELTQTRVHWVGDASNHLILCHPLLLPPSVFPSIRVFSNELVLHIRWPKYWSFSFSISLSNEYSGLISFRMDWLDFLAVQGTLKSLFQCHSSKAAILQRSAFFIVQLSYPYMTTGKTITLTIWNF